MMMPLSSSTGQLESGPPPSRRGRRLVGIGIAAVVGAGVAALVQGIHDDTTSPEQAFVETWIGAWNDRDAQTVSSMTCAFPSAFVPAGLIQVLLDQVPAGRPVLADYTVTSTAPGVVADREVTQVRVSYVPGERDTVRERTVPVLERDDGELCIALPTSW